MASRLGKIPTTSILLQTSLFSSFSTRRIETLSRYDVATTEASARSARRRCSRNDGMPCDRCHVASAKVEVITRAGSVFLCSHHHQMHRKRDPGAGYQVRAGLSLGL